ncbi:hypothetical protein BDW75DRAFT_198854 [Aspergillus navahoensis]
MNSQGFPFPPPPPPPPSQQSQPQQQYSHNSAFTPYGQNPRGQRGGRGGGQFRGRGRGYGNRGGGGGGGGRGRGGHFMNSDANHSGGYAAATGGYTPMTYLGYPTQHMPNQQTGIPTPHYTPPPSQNFPSAVAGNMFASTPHYPQPAVHGTPYQQQSSYATPYTTPTTQQSPPYVQTHPTNQNATPSVQPTMMGPPIRWGFEGTGHSGSFPGPQHPNLRGPRQSSAYNHQSSSGNLANKRDHTSAFGKLQSTAPRVPAPPPVPSFGNPLPTKPPTPADSQRKSKKKRRKHNQLGLTPKTEEHESSEEEDDVDEETRLAAGGAGGAGTGVVLQVTYRGRTSELQTSADIAAWIAERKKRYPTQAKIEEKKKAMEDAKKAKEEAQRQQRETRKSAAVLAKKDQEKKEQKIRDSLDPADAAAKAKLKAEKLRRKLMKEEKRIAQAEADAERARKLDERQEDSVPAEREADQAQQQASAAHGEQVAGDSASDTSNDSDWTSSSGSDLSSSDSGESDNDDDSAPEQATSRREGPERVAPPVRDEKKRVCRHFARNGRCPRGKTCKFTHEKPERGPKAKPVENKGRKGLLEALLDRQKEDENRKLMETIMWLGENGLLDEPAAQHDASSVLPSHQPHESPTPVNASGAQIRNESKTDEVGEEGQPSEGTARV